MKKFLITSAFAVAITGTLFFTNVFASGTEPSEKTFTISGSELKSANINNSIPVTTDINEKSESDIQFSKITTKTVGSGDLIVEEWFDPNTYQNRVDTRIINISGSQDDEVKNVYNSVYMKDLFKKSIFIVRDDKGAPVSGSVTEYSDRVAKNNLTQSAIKGIFDPFISEYKKSEWKYESTQTSDDGKKLKKLSHTSKISVMDEELKKAYQGRKDKGLKDIFKEYNSVNYTYVDEATGLPVKSETYIDKNGKNVLYSEETYEFKNIKNTDGSIFNTDGVKLDTGKKVDFDPGNGVG